MTGGKFVTCSNSQNILFIVFNTFILLNDGLVITVHQVRVFLKGKGVAFLGLGGVGFITLATSVKFGIGPC